MSGRTPRWYYVLKEAEVLTGGDSLGPVGSRLVAETIIGLIEHDPDSYRNAVAPWGDAAVPTLESADGSRVEIASLRDLLRFAGVLVA